jgi:hypothetical protein
MSMEKKYDCTIYNSDSCPKAITVYREVNHNNLHTIHVGCWGVYCWQGQVTSTELSDISKKDLKLINAPSDLFINSIDEYGQKKVVEGMIQYTQNTPVDALFLAGDNVYNYSIPKDYLVSLVEKALNEYKHSLVEKALDEQTGIDMFPSKKAYKQDPKISGQQIDRQLSDGFVKCFKDLKLKDFFIGVGNHDVQNCYDLNQQLNFSPDYKLIGMYYNVVYKMSNFHVNFIVIDTNMYSEDMDMESEEYTCNSKIPYTVEDKNKQTQWVVDVIKKHKAEWNIIIGHVPYIANGHKSKQKTKFHKELDYVFDSLNKNGCYPQVYMCADEHNQQFLYQEKRKLSLVVAGSGGTALDRDIQNGYPHMTKYSRAVFGFVSFNFNVNELIIKYIKAQEQDDLEETFSIKIDTKGNII